MYSKTPLVQLNFYSPISQNS